MSILISTWQWVFREADECFLRQESAHRRWWLWHLRNERRGGFYSRVTTQISTFPQLITLRDNILSHVAAFLKHNHCCRFSISVWLVLLAKVSRRAMWRHGKSRLKVLSWEETLERNISFHSWWRAPEVFINWERYDEKLDIWSIGCVMAELILLEPLFPGTDYIDQLRRIIQVVGKPDDDTLDALCQPSTSSTVIPDGRTGDCCVCDRSAWILRGDGRISKSRFEWIIWIQKWSGNTRAPIWCISSRWAPISLDKTMQLCLLDVGIDFLSQLLTFDSRVRPTVEEALCKSNDPLLEWICKYHHALV